MAGRDFKRNKWFLVLFDVLMEFLWLAVVFVLPLLFLPFVYTTFELPKVVFFRGVTVLMLILWVAKVLFEGKMRLPVLKGLRLPAIAGIFFIIFYTLATVFSVAPVLSIFGWYPRFQGFYTSFCYMLLGIIIFFNLRGEKKLNRLLMAIMASVAFTSLIALLQLASANFLNFWDADRFLGRAYGTMAQPDFLGGFLAMTIPIILARVLQGKNYLLGVITIVLSLSALHFTLSRSAWLGFFVGLIFFLLILFYKKHKGKLFIITLCLPILAFVGLFLINANQDSQWIKTTPALNRLTFQGESLRSIQTRLVIWRNVLKQILDKPLLGYGPETLAITFPAYSPAILNRLEDFTNITDRSHNELLDIAQQTGIFGLLAMLSFLTAVFVTVARKVIKTLAKQDQVYTGFLSGILALFIANIFGFSVTVTAVYFALFLALIISFIAKKEYSVPIATHKPAKIVFILLITILCLKISFAHDLKLLAADLFFRSGMDNRNDSIANQRAVFDNFKQAESLAPLQSHYKLAFAKLAEGDFQHDYGSNGYPEDVENIYIALKHYIAKVAPLRDYDAFSLLAKAKLETILAKHNIPAAPVADSFFDGQSSSDFAEKAQNDFALAAFKAPNYAPVYFEWGKLLLFTGKFKSAAEKFEKYLSLVPDYYKWKKDLSRLPAQEQQQYKIFYKLHPDFDEVFRYIEQAKSMSSEHNF